MVLLALVFFVPVALGGAVACVVLRPGWARSWQLLAVRGIALAATALCFVIATAHFLLEQS